MQTTSIDAEIKNHSRHINIEAELIKMLYQQSYTAIFTVIITAMGIIAIYYNAFPGIRVFTWFSFVLALSFIRHLSIQKYKSLSPQGSDLIRWGWLFALFTFLSGLTWGSASIIFFTADDLQLFNILTLIIIVISVGSMLALSAFPVAFYMFVFTAMLPMIWRYLNIEEQSYNIFGYLLILYNIGLFKLARVNHKTLRDSITLRFENIDLIDQLTKQKEKAEQANISKTKFLAAASHDIRQPIHAMNLFLGALEDRVEREEQKTIVQKIQKSSAALSSLLDSLLDISKLDAGVIQINPKVFCISSLFESLQNEFTTSANEKNIRLKFIPTKHCIYSDYQIIERILRNLISNAIRYTQKGGILVGCRYYQGKILLAVYDTGIGIAEDQQQEIFNEFHQLHNPERDRSKGLGLGLSIVRRMAALLDISIITRSKPGKGSCFGILLPHVEKNISHVEKNETSASTLFFDNIYVLVIDDEEEIRDSLKQLLQSWHCSVSAFASGHEAENALKDKNNGPDIILADYRLRNNETGTDAIDRIKRLFPEDSIPAIIITGDTAPERIKEADISGHMVLHKPVLPDILRLSLARVLDKNPYS